MFKAYKAYSETIYNSENGKVKLFVDDNKENTKFKLLFKPYILHPKSFESITDVSFKITEDSVIKIKSSFY